MRIDKIEVQNFKKFENECFEFPQGVSGEDHHGSFHVLVGENGVGKTSILDAVAVALSVWLEKVPDATLKNSRRRLVADNKRLVASTGGDRTLLMQAKGDMLVKADGRILGNEISWGQSLDQGKRNISNRGSKDAIGLIEGAYSEIQDGNTRLLPVIAYYGAGRAWLPHNERKNVKAKSNGGRSNRWEAFYDCLNDRIRLADLNKWFLNEAIARGNREGRYRPGFQAVLRAVYGVVPGADDLFYEPERNEIILSIDSNPQPFSNLSAGQRTLFSLVADIAIKMVVQNNFLVPPDDLPGGIEVIPEVLSRTPGVVLIDEIDVHLHPRWQRIVAKSLKRTFPSIQFITTTHSPQVIGEMSPKEVCLLSNEGGESPNQSFGMDTNWILDVLMEADSQTPEVKSELDAIYDLIQSEDLDSAHDRAMRLRQLIGNSQSLQRIISTIERIRRLGK